ncbi:MAG: hypothetical protein HZA58_08650 [Acidimicrobiia bacterium]|nr:hypothetical protein [Acidimicrobiia bacterium]
MSNRMTTLLWFLLGITVTLAIVLGVIVLSGDDEGGGTAATTTTLATETTATTAPTTTGVETTVTTAGGTTAPTTAPAGACAGLPSATTPAIPGPGVSVAIGDFDADGTTDNFIGYQKGDGTFWIQIALSYGYATEIEAYTKAQVYGAQPFSYTGGADPWIGIAGVDTGASTEVLQFFQLDGCTIVKSTVDGSIEASFIIGGGVMHLDGLVCGAEGFTTRSAQTGDGTNWEYYTTDYQWDPVARTFVNLGVAASTLVSPADDDAIFTAAEFNCPFAP